MNQRRQPSKGGWFFNDRRQSLVAPSPSDQFPNRVVRTQAAGRVVVRRALADRARSGLFQTFDGYGADITKVGGAAHSAVSRMGVRLGTGAYKCRVETTPKTSADAVQGPEWRFIQTFRA